MYNGQCINNIYIITLWTIHNQDHQSSLKSVLDFNQKSNNPLEH